MDLIDLKNMIGRNIRKYRLQKKITQNDLATNCKFAQNYISDIENGKRNITLNVLNDLANALGVNIKDLFEKTFEE